MSQGSGSRRRPGNEKRSITSKRMPARAFPMTFVIRLWVLHWLDRLHFLRWHCRFGGAEIVQRWQEGHQEISEAVSEDSSVVGYYFGWNRKNPVRGVVPGITIPRRGQAVFDGCIRVRTASRRIGRQDYGNWNIVFVIFQTRCAVSALALGEKMAVELWGKGGGGRVHFFDVEARRERHVRW